ncbi:MAG: uracil-DNA glycosylase, partial [Bradyrhizobium sp.]
MTPDPAPTAQQLLAFYLEAGVDCALTDEPVNRLAEPDAAPAVREAALPQPLRTIPAATPAA